MLGQKQMSAHSEEAKTSLLLSQLEKSPQQSENKYELFEMFLSFLNTANGEELNSVLCGYWCNLFRVLVGSYPREVF